MIDTVGLGQKIADARKLRGLTQGDLAKAVGVTAQAVSKWERGNSCPDIAILDEVARALSILVSDLLGIA
jgi:transcriptional regulator with XRE-family HTH domain